MFFYIGITLILTSCGGGGSGGGGTSPAPPINMGTAINKFYDGDLTSFSSVSYTFDVAPNTEGTYISVELYGIRLNQSAWNIAGGTFNAPAVELSRVTFPDQGLLKHQLNDTIANFWFFGYRDTEIPLYYLPASAVPITYQVTVRRQSAAAKGAPFKLRVNTVDMETQFGPIQNEVELDSGNQNDNLLQLTNEDEILRDNPGPEFDEIISGLFKNNDPDFYYIDITATAGNPVLSCFEIFAQRNGMMDEQISPDYPDPELHLYGPDTSSYPAVNLVDDYLYTDPKICRKVTADNRYAVEVTETPSNPETDTKYLLAYTEERFTSIVPEVASSLASPQAISYGDLVEGTLSPASTETHWYSFTAEPGDMILIRQFDKLLAEDSDDLIKIQLHAPDSINTTEDPIPFDGPFNDRSVSAANLDMSTRSILFQSSTAADYRIKVQEDSDQLTPPASIDYSFHIQKLKASDLETEPNDTLPANTPSTFLVDAANDVATASGEISSALDVDIFELDATDLSDMNITAGDMVIVHIYATDDFDLKANDNAGWGSQLEPKMTVLDDASAALTSASYVTDTTSEATAEGMRDPLPTFSVAFEATASTFYRVLVEVSGTWLPPGTFLSGTPKANSYLVEVVNLGQ
ncbi:MAG: hypothetical protein C0623_14435 [Desulfuromonas sp.]|nr:MAG: hypothetical protein C0623_14435 [Desulfuromonas sp.]